MTLYIDIETFSGVDLRGTTPYRYVEDPRFQILFAWYAIDDGPVLLAIGDDQVNAIPGLWDGGTKVAHNAAFERICFSRYAHLAGMMGWPSFLPPEQWIDTMMMAGELGYPQSLEHLGKALEGELKSKAGQALITLFCKPNKKGQRNMPEDYPEKWAEFLAYGKQDVATLRSVHQAMLAYGEIPETEFQAYFADQRINDRGMLLDEPMMHAGVAAVELNQMKNELEFSHLTGVMNPNSNPQVLAWFQTNGLKTMKDLRAETVERRLASPAVNSGTDRANLVKRVLELRQELAFTTGKKYMAARDGMSCDGRLRGQFKFFGAHTGRWSSRGVQVQNLTRANLGSELATDSAILDLLLGDETDSETLKRLIRAMFLINGTVVDYAAIEARVIAWEANETWALDAFKIGRDIYVETASRMSTPGNVLTRSQGKVAVLALGYNGGVGSLRAMGGEGTDEELQRLVTQWRLANRRIVGLWAALGEAFKVGGQAGNLHVEVRGKDRWLWLPSGRAIVYHDVRVNETFRYQNDDGKWITKTADGFADPKGGRAMTYGGRLSENATQAIARDLLAAALVRLERAGYLVVGHVHDEALIEGSRDVETIKSIMCDSPAWAKGLPVDGEGFTCFRYRKG